MYMYMYMYVYVYVYTYMYMCVHISWDQCIIGLLYYLIYLKLILAVFHSPIGEIPVLLQ